MIIYLSREYYRKWQEAEKTNKETERAADTATESSDKSAASANAESSQASTGATTEMSQAGYLPVTGPEVSLGNLIGLYSLSFALAAFIVSRGETA